MKVASKNVRKYLSLSLSQNYFVIQARMRVKRYPFLNEAVGGLNHVVKSSFYLMG